MRISFATTPTAERHPRASLRASLTLGLVACVVAASGAYGAGSDDCADLTAVVTAGGEQFGAIRGASEPRDRWKVTRAIPGYEGCRLQRINGDLSYVCETQIVGSQTENDERFAREKARVTACLGAGFSPFVTMARNFASSDGRLIVSLSAQPAIDFEAVRRNATEGKTIESGWNVLLSIFPSQKADSGASPPASPARSFDLATLERPDFCQSVQWLCKDALGEFASAKGRALDDESWESTHPLPGTERCRVSRIDDLLYHTCRGGEYAARDPAVAVARAIAKSVGQCLGSGFQQREHPRGERLTLNVERSETDPSVDVRVSGTGAGPWSVHVDVEPPETR